MLLKAKGEEQPKHGPSLATRPSSKRRSEGVLSGAVADGWLTANGTIRDMLQGLAKEQILTLSWLTCLLWWLKPIFRDKGEGRSPWTAFIVAAILVAVSYTALDFYFRLAGAGFVAVFGSWRSDPRTYFVPEFGIPVVLLILRGVQRGVTHMLRHWRSSIRDSIIAAGVVLLPFWAYRVAWTLPHEIDRQAGNTMAPIVSLLPLPVNWRSLSVTHNHNPVGVTRSLSVQFIFKDSPLFTEHRKRIISSDINALYEYLENIGLMISPRLPPLGVRTKGGAGSAGIFPGDPVYDYSIVISNDMLDKPCCACGMYADYWFKVIVGLNAGPGFSWNLYGYRMDTADILSTYYVSSMTGSLPTWAGGHIWLLALWQLRKDFGQRYMDQLLRYAATSEEISGIRLDPTTPTADFNKYFYHRIFMGNKVVDNEELTHLSRLNALLQSRGLFPSY